MRFRIVSCGLLLHLLLLSSATSTDIITSQVFGEDTQLLPAAFGDFNSDQLTDLFVLRNGGKTVEILLGSTDEAAPLLRAANLKCSFSECSIANVVPGDFNGDAFMDVAVAVKCPGKRNERGKSGRGQGLLDVHVLWGGQNRLNCSHDEGNPVLSVLGEPLALDANNDFVIDLFGVNEKGERGIWFFGNDSRFPDFRLLYERDRGHFKMRDPHSNAYLDLNGDNVADLFLTVQSQNSFSFELWRGRPKKSSFFFYDRIEAPPEAKRILGQALFLDLELVGKLNLLVPVLDERNPRILAYADDENGWRDLKVDFKFDGEIWSFPESGLSLSRAITLRAGDYNMDGFPDLLATLARGNRLRRTFLLENVPCRSGCDHFKRSFRIRWNFDFPKESNDSVAGFFYDIFQDGILDVILVGRRPDGSHHVTAIKNNLDYDANFIKVMVLTGLAHNRGERLDGKKSAVGTNLPGPRVAYRTVDQDGFVRTGVSGQMPQSAHFSLNLPYVVFALGRTPNFVDNITVGFASEKRDLLQVIPNSQMVVIPIQIDNPAKWRVQLFVTPSKIIVLSGVALAGTCCLIILVVLFLHWKEKKSDRLERLQEAHRFNFDAM